MLVGWRAHVVSGVLCWSAISGWDKSFSRGVVS